MDLSTECPCGVAVVSAEHALRAGLSYCRVGEQHVTWRHAAPNPGPFLCNARGVTVSSRKRWGAQELGRTELLAGPCCRCSQVTAVPQAGSSCACSAFPGQGALLTTRRWEGQDPGANPGVLWDGSVDTCWEQSGHICLKSRRTWTPNIKGKPRKPNTQSFQVAAEVRLTFFLQPVSRVRQMWVSLKYCPFSNLQQTHTLKPCISSSSWKEISWFRDFSKPLKIFVCALPPQLLGALKTTAFAGRQ